MEDYKFKRTINESRAVKLKAAIGELVENRGSWNCERQEEMIRVFQWLQTFNARVSPKSVH